MEKFGRSTLRATRRQAVQPVPTPHSQSTDVKDVRRQLGWGLVELARKGTLR